MSITLPKEFAALQPYADKWAQPTEYERMRTRRESTPTEIKAFYDAALPMLQVILDRADKYPLGKIEGVDRHLYHLALSLAEVAPHVEFYKCNPGVPYAFDERRLMGLHCAVPD